jgi:hypothetical protein
MIGVAAAASEREIASEFFELFKTPWEFYRPGQSYDVVLCTRADLCPSGEKLVLIYNAGVTSFDAENRVAVRTAGLGATALWNGQRLPIYGRSATFANNRFGELKQEGTQAPMAFLKETGKQTVLRVGYDLFQEIRSLLTAGQPATNANMPALELHISLLRDVITRSGIALLEIPPVPSGYKFMSCLTHDLDHPSLRKHCFDHTMFGFLYRATVQTLVHACRGRKPVRKVARNLAAASRLPLVYLGVARDPWSGFDRYLQIEAGAGSTYFVIAKRDYAGRAASGQAPLKRASRYSVTDIKPQLEKIMSAGCEVSLHGLDAWLDSDSGSEERETLFKTSGTRETGVRMHWLYFNEQSPAALDRAGFSYDSSFGYNQTVGFRAGTAQAFKPVGTANLLELPLHVMDTALFYPNYLDLSEREAEALVWKIIDATEQHGGALTINWHDRSIAPERLWNDFYVKLLEELKRRGAWLPTAANAVAWFRTRRSASFGTVSRDNGRIKIAVSVKGGSQLPGLRARVHQPKARHLLESVSSKNGQSFRDTNLTNNADQEVTITN